MKAKVTVSRDGKVQAEYDTGRITLVGWVQRAPRTSRMWMAIRDGGRVVTSKAKRRSEAVAALLAFVGIEAA